MKKIEIIKLLIVMAFPVSMGALVSCGQDSHHGKDHEHEIGNVHEAEEHHDMNGSGLQFGEEKTAEAFEHYLHVKNALVQGDVEEAEKAAIALGKVWKGGDGDDGVSEVIAELVSRNELSGQRQVFSELSQILESEFENGLSSGKLYKQFCPMALDNKGAYWLSKEEKIRNPYFGDKMLTCGEVKKVISRP